MLEYFIHLFKENNSQKEEEHIIFALFVNSACYLSCYSTPYLVFRLTYHTYAYLLLLFFSFECYFYYYYVVLFLFFLLLSDGKHKRKIILFIFLFTLFIIYFWLTDWVVVKKTWNLSGGWYASYIRIEKNGNFKNKIKHERNSKKGKRPSVYRTKLAFYFFFSERMWNWCASSLLLCHDTIVQNDWTWFKYHFKYLS